MVKVETIKMTDREAMIVIFENSLRVSKERIDRMEYELRSKARDLELAKAVYRADEIAINNLRINSVDIKV